MNDGDSWSRTSTSNSETYIFRTGEFFRTEQRIKNPRQLYDILLKLLKNLEKMLLFFLIGSGVIAQQLIDLNIILYEV